MTSLVPIATRRLFAALTCLFAAPLASPVATAAEIVLQNDSVPVTGSNNPLLQFIPNEQVATWHTAPATGDLVGVQIQWDSLFGGNPPSQELFVNIYAGGTFPTPGPLLAQVSAPVLSDGSKNEIRHLDPPLNALPIQIPFTTGQSFVVALEFLNASNPPLGSGVEIDQDGIQAGKNSVFVNPGGWLDAIPLGVTGDFAIRAVFNPVPEPSAFCLAIAAVLTIAHRRRR